MKYILALATSVLLGWLAYSALTAPSRAQQACENIEATCGAFAQDEMAGCQSDLRDIDAMLGDDILVQIDDCVLASHSCSDAIACMTSDIGRSTTSGLFRLSSDESTVADNSDIDRADDESAESGSELDGETAQ